MQKRFDGQDAYISYLVQEIVNIESPQTGNADHRATGCVHLGDEKVKEIPERPPKDSVTKNHNQLDVNTKFQYQIEDSDPFSVQRRNCSSSGGLGDEDFSSDFSLFTTGQIGAFSVDNSVPCAGGYSQVQLETVNQIHPAGLANTWGFNTGVFSNAGSEKKCANVCDNSTEAQERLKKKRKRKSEKYEECTQTVSDIELKEIAENHKKTFDRNNFYFQEFMKMPKKPKTVDKGCAIENMKKDSLEGSHELASDICVKLEELSNDTNDSEATNEWGGNKNEHWIEKSNSTVKVTEKEHLCAINAPSSESGPDFDNEKRGVDEVSSQGPCLCIHCAELFSSQTDLEQHIRDTHDLKEEEKAGTSTAKQKEETAYYLTSVELDKKLLKQRKEEKVVQNEVKDVTDAVSNPVRSLDVKHKQAEQMLKQKKKLKSLREWKNVANRSVNVTAGSRIMKSDRACRKIVSEQKPEVLIPQPRSVQRRSRDIIGKSTDIVNSSNASVKLGVVIADDDLKETCLNSGKKAVICLERIPKGFDDISPEATEVETMKKYKPGSKSHKNSNNIVKQNANNEDYVANKPKDYVLEKFVLEADKSSIRQSRAKNNLMNPSKGKQKRVISPRTRKDEILMKQFGIIPSKVFLDKVGTGVASDSSCSGGFVKSSPNKKCAVINSPHKTRGGKVPLSASDSGINVDFSDSDTDEKTDAKTTDSVLLDFDALINSGTLHSEDDDHVKKVKIDEKGSGIDVKVQPRKGSGKSNPKCVSKSVSSIKLQHKNRNENKDSKLTEKFGIKNMSVSISPMLSMNSRTSLLSRPTSLKKAKIGPKSKVQLSQNRPNIESMSSDEMSKLLQQCGMAISVPALPLKTREKTPEPSTSKGHGLLKRKRTARKSCVDNELVKKFNLKESIVELECLSKIEISMLRNPHSKFGKTSSWLQQKFDTDSESEVEWDIPSPLKSEDFVEDEVDYAKELKTSGVESKQNVSSKFASKGDEELLRKFGISDAKVVVENQCMQSYAENSQTGYNAGNLMDRQDSNKRFGDDELLKKFGITKLVVVATKTEQSSVNLDLKSEEFKDFFKKSMDATKHLIKKSKTVSLNNSRTENESETNATKELKEVIDKTTTCVETSRKRPRPRSPKKENVMADQITVNKDEPKSDDSTSEKQTLSTERKLRSRLRLESENPETESEEAFSSVKKRKMVCRTPQLKSKENIGDLVLTSTPKVTTKSMSAVVTTQQSKTKAPTVQKARQCRKVVKVQLSDSKKTCLKYASSGRNALLNKMRTSPLSIKTSKVKRMQRKQLGSVIAAQSTEKLEKCLSNVQIRLPLLTPEEINRYTKHIESVNDTVEVVQNNESSDIKDEKEDEIVTHVKELEHEECYKKATVAYWENKLSKLDSENSSQTNTGSDSKCTDLNENLEDPNRSTIDSRSIALKNDEIDGSNKQNTICEMKGNTVKNRNTSVEALDSIEMGVDTAKDSASVTNEKAEVQTVKDQVLNEMPEDWNENLNDSDTLVQCKTKSAKSELKNKERCSTFVNEMVVENYPSDSETKESCSVDEEDILELDINAEKSLNEVNVVYDKQDANYENGAEYELDMENACILDDSVS